MEQVNPFEMTEDEIAAVNGRYTKRLVDIEGAIARAFFNPKAMVLMDPDDPTVDVNELYQRRGQEMTDLKLMNFNCPMCYKTMAYELFVPHVEYCFTKWYKLTDPSKRNFSGPQQSTSIIGAVASADSAGEVKED